LAGLLAAVVLLVLAQPAAAGELEKRLNEAWGTTYRAPATADLDKAQALFRSMFRGDFGNSVKSGWKSIGFEMGRLVLPAGAVYYVREQPDKKTGRGFYAVRPGVPPRLLQGPHKSNDLHTDVITARAVEEHGFAGGAWNTVSRKLVDLAHVKASFFNSFTRAFGEAHGAGGTIAQVHGYSTSLHPEFPAETNHILSPVEYTHLEQYRGLGWVRGTAVPADHWVWRYRECMEVMPRILETLVYPDEVGDLGGFPDDNTPNTNKEALWSVAPEADFLHVELSLPERERLRDDVTVRGLFAGCLLDPARR
jgi:hypothetical protein